MSHNPDTLAKPDTTNPTELERYNQIKKVTIVGALLNIFLAFAKVIFGYIGQS